MQIASTDQPRASTIESFSWMFHLYQTYILNKLFQEIQYTLFFLHQYFFKLLFLYYIVLIYLFHIKINTFTVNWLITYYDYDE